MHKMLRTIPNQSNDKYCGLTWFEMDTLRAGDDHVEHPEFIAVTDGAPGSTIRAAYNFARPRKSVQRLIDLKMLEFVRHETYARGAQCDVYKLSYKGKQTVEAFYSSVDARTQDARDDFAARRASRQRELDRLTLTTALEIQFGGNYYIPSLQDMIDKSQTPFLDVPMPTIAPTGSDGLPVTIREYLICLWFRVLPDDLYKRISSFLKWGDVIGFDDAAAMFLDSVDSDQDEDDDDGDMHSPYGRLS